MVLHGISESFSFLTPGDAFDWVGLIRVNSVVYRWLGQPVMDLPAALQTSVTVKPTTTRYTFEAHLHPIAWKSIHLHTVIYYYMVCMRLCILYYRIYMIYSYIHLL